MMTRLAALLLAVTCAFVLACGEDVERSGDWELDDDLEEPAVASAWAYHIPTGAPRTGINIELAEPEVCVVFLIVGSIEPGLTYEVDLEPGPLMPGVVEGSCEGVTALTQLPENSLLPRTAEGQVVTHGRHERGYAKFFDVDVMFEFDTSDASFLPQELSVQAQNIEFRSQ